MARPQATSDSRHDVPAPAGARGEDTRSRAMTWPRNAPRALLGETMPHPIQSARRNYNAIAAGEGKTCGNTIKEHEPKPQAVRAARLVDALRKTTRRASKTSRTPRTSPGRSDQSALLLSATRPINARAELLEDVAPTVSAVPTSLREAVARLQAEARAMRMDSNRLGHAVQELQPQRPRVAVEVVA